jgi:DeoR/GlpR family transcriptional regulator of sugar metabolism
MLQIQRIQKTLEYLEEKEVLTVDEAVRLWGVSPPTVRRDFNLLAKEPFIQRVHGGIKLVKYPGGDMTPVEYREIRFPFEKRALAEKAAGLLRPGNVAVIDGGTTTSMLSEFIPDFQLLIVTNSVRLVAGLEGQHRKRVDLAIFVTGGVLYPHSGILLGPTTQTAISQYHAQWAFLSVSGITDSQIFNTNELVVATERTMIESAEKVVILADHSKIGKRVGSPVTSLDNVDILFTDQSPENDQMLQRIENAGVQVNRVPVSPLDRIEDDKRRPFGAVEAPTIGRTGASRDR